MQYPAKQGPGVVPKRGRISLRIHRGSRSSSLLGPQIRLVWGPGSDELRLLRWILAELRPHSRSTPGPWDFGESFFFAMLHVWCLVCASVMVTSAKPVIFGLEMRLEKNLLWKIIENYFEIFKITLLFIGEFFLVSGCGYIIQVFALELVHGKKWLHYVLKLLNLS